jgi:hypothetical protein
MHTQLVSLKLSELMITLQAMHCHVRNPSILLVDCAKLFFNELWHFMHNDTNNAEKNSMSYLGVKGGCLGTQSHLNQ